MSRHATHRSGPDSVESPWQELVMVLTSSAPPWLKRRSYMGDGDIYSRSSMAAIEKIEAALIGGRMLLVDHLQGLKHWA